MGESLPHRPLAGPRPGRRLRRRARIQWLPLLVRCLRWISVTDAVRLEQPQYQASELISGLPG